MTPQRGSRFPNRRLSLLGRLHDAEQDYIVKRRSTCEGIGQVDLDADNTRWIDIGQAIATLARLIQSHCVASECCSARPAVEMLTARMSEAIDDQLDGPSWAVIDAAARLEAVRLS